MTGWSTADVPSMRGRVAVVTGGHRGLGWWTVLGLVRAGAEVIVGSRSLTRAEPPIEQVRALVPDAQVRVERLDLASQASIRDFVTRANAAAPIDLLVNCAGAVIPTREITQDGFERTLATNYLGPFALTLGLMPSLLRAPHPRVTTVSSLGAEQGKKKVDFEDLQSERQYSPQVAYNRSKLADLVFTVELGARSTAAGLPLISDAAHPGLARTDLQWGVHGRRPSAGIRFLMRLFGQSPEQGARSILRGATDPAARSGDYYGPERGLKGDVVLSAVYPPALDPQVRAKLWTTSEKLTGVRWSPLDFARTPTLSVESC
jgi:NAD(P)-dependent dehydrogenase (short-subunit alcohol dehydrogenase family)